VARSAWVRKNAPRWCGLGVDRFHVSRNYRGTSKSHAGTRYTTIRGQWTPTLFIANAHLGRRWLLIHEMAHWFAGPGNRHGPKYAQIYLGLVRRFLGAEAAKALRAGYKRHRVRYRIVSRERQTY
jgi:putative metallohydrolase (TIGR04338 family)